MALSDDAMAKELLAAGVPLPRVAELFPSAPEQALNAAAREVVAAGKCPDADLGRAVLERSNSATKDAEFVDMHIANLTKDAPEELLDPLFFTLMRDPVVISTGYVMDRSHVLDEQGRLKFRNCPFTRASLKDDVYPLVEKRKQLQEFKEQRLEAMCSAAQIFLKTRQFGQFDEVIRIAEAFVDDLGEATYLHQAKKLAELRLEAAETAGHVFSPAEFAKILIRIHRASLSEFSSSQDASLRFQERVMLLEARTRDALAAKNMEEASEWCKACEAVRAESKVFLPVASLQLELAKQQGKDLYRPRILAYRELGGDPEAIKQFFEIEQIGPSDVIDHRPILLCCGRIMERTADDVWHCAQRSEPIETTMERIVVRVGTFHDQGWGNQKANLGLALYDTEGVLVARCNIFGTYRTPGCTYPDTSSRALDETEEVVALARPGFTYSLEYTVGGGGGHSIEVVPFFCFIYPKASQSIVACRIADPEGDEGDYRGPKDSDGHATGYGELEYDDGDIFVGRFHNGGMLEGVVHRASSVQFTMKERCWTTAIDAGLVEQYPLSSVIVAGSLDREQGASDGGDDMYLGEDYDYDESGEDF